MSKIQWYVRPVIATEDGPASKCWKCWVAPMAVKANKLFNARDRAETWRDAGGRSRADKRDAGIGGSSGAIHFPLLQQKEAASPCNKSAWQDEHDLFQRGAVHRVRDMSWWKQSHHAGGSSGMIFITF